MAIESKLTLRRTVADDLDTLFTFQLDPDANYLAAFTSADSTDKAAFVQKHTRFLDDPTIHAMTIILEDEIVGSLAKFEMDGEAEVTYWIDKRFWGKGIATQALRTFLTIESARPIFARAAFDNVGSRKVLEKCGFVRIGEDKGFANARQTEVEEYIYRLA
jgi:RimJ/RimL family protein N-acetyltransferase